MVLINPVCRATVVRLGRGFGQTWLIYARWRYHWQQQRLVATTATLAPVVGDWWAVLRFRHPPFWWDVVPLNFDAMLDGYEVPLQRRCRGLHVISLLEEIFRKFDVIKEQPGINNLGSRDAAAHLQGVRLLVLHAEGVAQSLKDLKHRPLEVTAFPK